MNLALGLSLCGSLTPGTEPQQVHIILATGSSPAMGYELGYGNRVNPTYPANLQAVDYDTALTAQRVGAITEPLDWPGNDFASSLGLSATSVFGIDRANATISDVVIVPGATTGGRLQNGGEWDQPSGANFLSSVSGVDYALANVEGGPALTDMTWIGSGGQHAEGQTAAESESNFLGLVSHFRTNYNPDMKVLTAGALLVNSYGMADTGRSDGTALSDRLPNRSYHESQRQMPLDNDNFFHLVPPLRFFNGHALTGDVVVDSLSDGHFSEEASSAIGLAWAVARPLIEGLTASPPGLITGLADAGNGAVSFLVPATGAHKYVMRYRDNGTDDQWIEIDRWPHWGGQLPGEVCYANVPTTSANAQEVQIKAVSRGGESAYSASVVCAGVQRGTGWRVKVTATNGNAFANCWSVVFRQVASGPDICLEVDRFAQGSVFSGNNAAQRVFNGRNASPGWVSASGGAAGGSAWFGIFFDEPIFVGSIDWGSRGDGASQASDQAPNALNVDRSVDDGVSWQLAWSVSGQTAWDDNGEVRTFER